MDNGVYFNPETGETKVPYEKSWKKYLARRAERSRAENVEATNQGYPDYLTPEKYHSAATLYPMDEMDIIRKKYKRTNSPFPALQPVLTPTIFPQVQPPGFQGPGQRLVRGG